MGTLILIKITVLSPLVVTSLLNFNSIPFGVRENCGGRGRGAPAN